MDLARLSLFLVLLLAAALWDLRTGRLPNALTYGALVTGLTLSWLSPSVGLPAALAGLGLGFLPGLAMFVHGGMGGGDVKLLAAVGAFVGYPVIIDVLFYSIVVGTAMALALVIWKGRFAELLRGLRSHLLALVYRGMQPVTPATDIRIPFAAAIAGGSLWALAIPSLSLVGAFR